MKLISKMIFPNGLLSNEDYHSNDYISGTLLSSIYSKSVKHAIETKTKPSDALGFGIAAHAAIIEPDLFDDKFAKDIDKADFPFALHTNQDMQAWLSSRGRTKSGAKSQLLARIKETCEATGEEEPELFDDILAKHYSENKEKCLLKKKDYEQLIKMRSAIYSDKDTADILTGAYIESSILAEVDFYDEFNYGEPNTGQWIAQCQIRPDIITKAPSIFDYKTTIDASYERFGIDAYKMGYWLKMSFQRDIFELVNGVELKEIGFIAQEKLTASQESNPHEHVRYYMDDFQLEEGRKQYLSAMKQYIEYKHTGVAKGYEERDSILFTPKFAK